MKFYKKIRFKNKDDWKENHVKFLGGSSAGVIYGVSKWKTMLELYDEIVNPKREEEKTNENIELGVASEPLIRKTFRLNFPQYEVKDPKGWECYISTEKPYLGATVDGLLIDKLTGDKGILEIKTCDIRRKGDLDDWVNNIPMNYYCQILHYLMVMKDCKFVKVVAQLRLFDWSSELDSKVCELRTIVKHIERSEVEEQIKLLEKLEIDFWENHVEKKIPPTFTREIGG